VRDCTENLQQIASSPIALKPDICDERKIFRVMMLDYTGIVDVEESEFFITHFVNDAIGAFTVLNGTVTLAHLSCREKVKLSLQILKTFPRVIL
jgi:hypothetical protein